MITASGIGSGIDVEGIINQLMQFERAPVRALEQKRKALDVEISAFGSVKSAMNELASTARTLGDRNGFGPFVATSSDEEVFTASASGTAAAESHDIEVLSLASAHRVASAAYASDEADAATGTWTFGSGESAFSVELEAGARSLRDLRNAINDAPDNDGVVASLLNVDGGTRLTLTAREPGVEHSIAVTAPGGGDGGFTEITPASDASLIVDGFAVTRSTNLIGDVIEGVTLELAGTGTATIDTSRDMESLTESLDAFVTQYNALGKKLSDLAGGDLQGDRLPRDADLRLRRAFSEAITYGEGLSIVPTEMGLTFDKTGTLSIDKTRMSELQTANLERFVDMFAEGETGFAARIESVLEQFTRADGMINDREDGLDAQRTTIDRQVERQEYRLEKAEARYRRQFGNMDAMISELQSTSSYLASRLAYY